MPVKSKKPVKGSVHTSRASYDLWAQTVDHLAKTPRGLQKKRDELSTLDFVGALLKDHRSDLVQLWEAFTTERSEVSRYLMDPKREAMVYLLGFHLSNQARVEGALQRVENRSGLLSYLKKQSGALRLLDLGCGTGALSLSTVHELREESSKLGLSVELVDKSQAFLEAAVYGLEQLLPAQQVITRRQKLDEYLSRELSAGPSDDGWVWYQLGYVWNEIAHNPKTMQLLLRFLEAGLTKGRRIITLIEPANQDLSRATISLRNELLERGYRVLYPCPHQDSCPMLERTRDWCYSEFIWERPPLMREVDRMLKIDRHRIGCSAYVFASPDVAVSLQTQKATRSESIVVGRPLTQTRSKNSREFEYLLCTPEGLSKQKPEPASDGGVNELLRGQTLSKPALDPKFLPKAAKPS